jgi:hypothetical protein
VQVPVGKIQFRVDLVKEQNATPRAGTSYKEFKIRVYMPAFDGASRFHCKTPAGSSNFSIWIAIWM